MRAMIDHGGNPPPSKISIRSASVFPGFCAGHDGQLFRIVEDNDISFTADEAFLLAYRAIAYERFAKHWELRASALHREFDRGTPFETQVVVQTQLSANEYGIRKGLRDVERWKARYDERLISGVRSDLHFYAVRFDGLLPIVGCAAFQPQFDFSGQALQRLASSVDEYDHVAMVITSFKGQTVVMLAWVGADQGPAASFVRSFSSLPDNRKADAVVRLAFEHTDNVFLKPSWWDGLKRMEQGALLAQSRSGTAARTRSANCLTDAGTSYADLPVVREYV
jgi:hypothetical protein